MKRTCPQFRPEARHSAAALLTTISFRTRERLANLGGKSSRSWNSPAGATGSADAATSSGRAWLPDMKYLCVQPGRALPGTLIQ